MEVWRDSPFLFLAVIPHIFPHILLTILQLVKALVLAPFRDCDSPINTGDHPEPLKCFQRFSKPFLPWLLYV